MMDGQIKMLLKITADGASMLLDQGAYSLSRDIQNEMVELVREYGARPQ